MKIELSHHSSRTDPLSKHFFHDIKNQNKSERNLNALKQIFGQINFVSSDSSSCVC